MCIPVVCVFVHGIYQDVAVVVVEYLHWITVDAAQSPDPKCVFLYLTDPITLEEYCTCIHQ